jgi:hypothetical protein
MDRDCALSIDIGTKNLGYAIYSWDVNTTDTQPTTTTKRKRTPPQPSLPQLGDILIDFDILTIDDTKKKTDIVVKRVTAINEFFQTVSENYNIRYVIIERQVITNTPAMCLMYSVATVANNLGANVIIFDPKKKFSLLNVGYTTAKKEHKKQSVIYARNLLNYAYSDKLIDFDSHKKKDDVSDAINQGLLSLIERNIIDVDIVTIRSIMKSE